VNNYWAIWEESEFVLTILLFVVVIIIAIYFECKYLEERKKNRKYQSFFTYANKPTIAPLKPTSTIQKIGAGKPVLESVPMNKMNPSPTIPNRRTKTASIILSKFIGCIIRRLCNQKQIKPCLMLSLALGKGKADFFTVGFVFLVDIFHEGLEVFNGFSRFVSHVIILIYKLRISEVNYNIYTGMKPNGGYSWSPI